MDIIKHSCSVAWLPQEDSRLLSKVSELALEGMACYVYKRYFEEKEASIIDKHPRDWCRYTINAYYHVTVLCWVKLFGSDNEPTHYLKLLENDSIKKYVGKILKITDANSNDLKSHVLAYCNMTLDEFDEYRKKTKKYRDRVLIHSEHAPSKVSTGDMQYPKLDIAYKTFEWIYFFVVDILGCYPELSDEHNFQETPYFDINQRKTLMQLLDSITPSF